MSMHNAMLGALVADALSMPVHWYYDTNALDRDYPKVDAYLPPKNPHPDSILWRSSYKPRNKQADILHGQAKYWGQRGVHYHQFLDAGENTLNYKLGIELYHLLVEHGEYDPELWLNTYINRMREDGWHGDTYVEEYHRAFFDNLARGISPQKCGIKDIHIGGLTPVPFLLAALETFGDRTEEQDVSLVQEHLALTHHGQPIASAGQALTRMLHAISEGASLRSAIANHASVWASEEQFDTWSSLEDRTVVGGHLTMACYLPDSFTASLFLAWKYHDDFSAGIIANAKCGGDNGHRGVVVGSLLAAANGVPNDWLDGLKVHEQLSSFESEAIR